MLCNTGIQRLKSLIWDYGKHLNRDGKTIKQHANIMVSNLEKLLLIQKTVLKGTDGD